MLDQNIENFINADNVDYCLLLSGGWGCGKTFYIKKTLNSIVDKKNKKDKKELIYIYIYISLWDENG